MKKTYLHALCGAIALAGTTALTACSDKDTVETTADNIVQTGDIPVQFVFNVATNSGTTTRMSAETVQADRTKPFRGITDTRILVYSQDQGGQHISKPSDAVRLYDLATLVGNGAVTADNSTRVIELSLPNGTNSMMFYGRAIKSGTDKQQGNMRAYIYRDNAKDTTRFVLAPRVSQYEYDREGNIVGETDAYKVWMETKDLIITILNRITDNGLHDENALGVGTRDLRAHIWWPNDAGNYSLRGPQVNLAGLGAGTGLDTLTADNSNIEEAVQATQNVAITLHKGQTDYVVGTYVAATRQLRTNVDTYTLNLGDIEWKEYGQKAKGQATTHLSAAYELTPLEEILGNAYNMFTDMKQNENGIVTEVRAGSTSAINRMVQDLWTVTNEVYTAKPTQYAEAVAQALAARIYTRFATYFTATIDHNGIVGNCLFKSPKTLAAEVATFVPGKTAEGTYAHIYQDADTIDINLFPMTTVLNLPAGATQLLCTGGVFSYNDNLPMDGMGAPGATVSPLNYCWPTELLYYGNSPLRTSNQTVSPANFPNGISNWEKDAAWQSSEASWDGDRVTPLTRSVAMKYNIKYGMSVLATSIYYATNELEDNNMALNGESANTLVVENTGVSYDYNGEARQNNQRLVLTGVVVGGQCSEVGWNFVQKLNTEGNNFTMMVYDNDVPAGDTQGCPIPGYTPSLTGSADNYTLVLDNWDASKAGQAQSPVYVALEFKNCSGTDFWGRDNLVRDGGTFYLIGKLDPDIVFDGNAQKTLSATDRSEGIQWPEDSKSLPPFDANGNTIKERRVFIQDYMTKARFGLGKDALKNAYVTVPDLRSANLSLGLSVDIQWKDGLNYDMVLGQ